MLDFGGGVVPGQHSLLRMQTRECDEVLGLGDIHRLPVDAGRDTNHSATRVAERDGVDGLLYGPVVTGAVLCHLYHKGRHFEGSNENMMDDDGFVNKRVSKYRSLGKSEL